MSKEVLIVGGTASITPEMIESLESNGYSIHRMTYRQSGKIYGDYQWTMLDIENKDSVENFVNSLPKDFYSKIILNIGNSMGKHPRQASLDEISNFFQGFISNYVYIMSALVDSLCNGGQIISISSIAANRAIFDFNYSAAKAGVQAAARSLSFHMDNNKSIYSIAPGLIYDTQAMRESPKESYVVENLATKKQIAEIIINADQSYNGKVIEIGY